MSDASIIDGDAVLLERNDCPALIMNDELEERRGEGRSFSLPFDWPLAFVIIRGKGKEMEKVGADTTLRMREVHVHVQDPAICVVMACFETDISLSPAGNSKAANHQ